MNYLRNHLLQITCVFYVMILLYITSNLISNAPISGDASENFRMAYNLYKHGVLSVDNEENADMISPANQREPFPPVITALVMHIHPGIDKSMTYASFANGVNTEKVKQVNLFWIAFLLIGLVFLIRSFTKSQMALFTLFILVSFYFILYSSNFDRLYTEFPTAALMVLSTVLFIHGIKKKNKLLYALSGIVFGLLVLTKAIFFYLFPLVFIALFFLSYFPKNPFDKKAAYMHSGLFLLGGLFIITPWLIRNKVYLGEYQITQRGGIVLHFRAIHNQMTNEEVIGAFHFFGPELYQLISGKIFDIEDSDFDENGKFRRLNRQNPNGNAVSEGRPDQITSLYAYTWAERTRLINYYSHEGMESPPHLAEARLGEEAKEMILENPIKHVGMTSVFLWRGMWCFPYRNVPFGGHALQNFAHYINNMVNFLAFTSFIGLFILGWRKKNAAYLALLLLPCFMILLQSFVSHNIPRYSQPAIPLALLSLILMIEYAVHQVKKPGFPYLMKNR